MTNLNDLLESIQLAIFDLDGVIYRGSTLLPGVKKFITELKERPIKIVYNTNNSTATRKSYMSRLNQMGIRSNINDFYTSAFIAAEEITLIKAKANIYVIGETGLKEELKMKGHNILTENDDFEMVDFIIVGLDRDFNYKKLRYAQKCILEGKAKFYATNSDATLPVDNELLPGAGVMVNALKVCTNREPVKIYGKPNPDGILKILNDFNVNPNNAVIFGDRLDTDILAGNRANIRTVLILTGVTRREDVNILLNNSLNNKKSVPDLIIDSLDKFEIVG